MDASVAVKWLFSDEERADRAQALQEVALRTEEPLIAPALFPFEVTNVVRRRMVRHGLSLPLAAALLDQFLRVPVALHTPESLHQDALAIAHAHQPPVAYDAQCLALARQMGCEVWTDDCRLIHAVGGSLPFVRWIGDYVPDDAG